MVVDEMEKKDKSLSKLEGLVPWSCKVGQVKAQNLAAHRDYLPLQGIDLEGLGPGDNSGKQVTVGRESWM